MYKALKISVLTLFLSGIITAQTEYSDQPGGYALSSQGKINVLIVFAQFADDSYNPENEHWRAGEAPADITNWVDSEWSASPTQGSLTHYYNEMSFGKLKFTGKTVSIITPHTREWYLQNKKKRNFIHQELFEKIDSEMSFEQFDNWTKDAFFKHRNVPDNNIDMVFVIWRNIAADYQGRERDSINKVLDMASDYGDLGGGEFPVDDSARVIKMYSFGSGVTIRDYVEAYNNGDLIKTFRITVHEFGHYLMGGNNYHNGFGFWGMLCSWGIRSLVPNSFERHRMGWITVPTIKPRATRTYHDLKLADYVTSGEALRLEIDSSKGEYFYLENHQGKSYWEKDFKYNLTPPGLYVLRKDGFIPSTVNDKPNSAYFRMIPADGRYNWEVTQATPNIWGNPNDSLPVFKQIIADRDSGYSDIEFIPWKWKGRQMPPGVIHFTENDSGGVQRDVRYAGDGKDAFNKNYNEVFSPWSNPNSQDKKRKATPYGFYLKDFSNEVATLDVYVNTAIEAPPSKPQALIVTGKKLSGKTYPELTWQLNPEDDITEYLIERKTNDEPYKQIASINRKINHFVDKDIKYMTNNNNALYRIRCKDKDGKLSVYSEERR